MRSASRFICIAPVVVLAGCLSSSPQPMDSRAGMLRDDVNAVACCMDDATWTVKRVGGDMEAAITGKSGNYRFAPTNSLIDTELPEGYPEPTPPGSIDIKKYPAARRAEVSGKLNPDLGSNLGFWPLFQHIQQNEIAMTSPVEMDYRDWGDSRYDNPRAWTMSFLYRRADMGAVGSDGRVQVVDTQPITVIALGMTGPYRLATVRTGISKLNDWLVAQSEWESVGGHDPRALYYNDPSVPDRRKWMEVQIAVRRVSK